MCRTALIVTLLVLGADASAQDLANGRDVYGPCAACHGANGEGGKQGEYPRVAGQPAAYLVAQLKLFQTRKRLNIPMLPYTEPRELSDTDMRDVAAHLTGIDLPTRAPHFKDTDGALERLLAMEKVLVVPRVEGDVAAGRALLKKKCASCHGRTGRGKPGKAFPRLVGQYPAYLERQFAAYQRGARPHEGEEPGGGVMAKLSPEDVRNVLAYLTAVQDSEDDEPDAGAGGGT